jgi:hypothetical protein
MSRGPGKIQNYLTGLLLNYSPDPMTFAEIMAIAYPEGSFESDMAKALGGSRVGRVRSLRRALRRLCDTGDVLVLGEGSRSDPHRYWLDPLNPMASSDAPNAVHLGELLLEARCQTTHKEFCDCIKREFKMSPERAEQFIDIAYRTRMGKIRPESQTLE